MAHAAAVITVQGDNQDCLEVFTDDTKAQTIGFIFSEHNACLVEAAPDLLDAAKLALNELRELDEVLTLAAAWSPRTQLTLDALTDAITKAEGRNEP